MPVYVEPSLLDGISPGLRRRMQGKSCFNFAKVDEALFAELEDLTRAGFEATGLHPRWGAAERDERGWKPGGPRASVPSQQPSCIAERHDLSHRFVERHASAAFVGGRPVSRIEASVESARTGPLHDRRIPTGPSGGRTP